MPTVFLSPPDNYKQQEIIPNPFLWVSYNNNWSYLYTLFSTLKNYVFQPKSKLS